MSQQIESNTNIDPIDIIEQKESLGSTTIIASSFISSPNMVFGATDALRTFSTKKIENQEVEKLKLEIEQIELDSQLALLKESAYKGDSTAMYEIGLRYKTGKGVPVDEIKAFKWFKSSADEKNIDSLFELALILQNAKDEGENYLNAFRYFIAAAKAGNWRAIDYIFKLQETKKFYNVKEFGVLLYDIAYLYYYGRTIRKVNYDVKELFQKSAECGNSLSMYFVGMKFRHDGDYKTAVEWFLKSALLGHDTAALALGELYYEGGHGINRNLFMSKVWYKESSDLGYAHAREFLNNRNNWKEDEMYKTGKSSKTILSFKSDTTTPIRAELEKSQSPSHSQFEDPIIDDTLYLKGLSFESGGKLSKPDYTKALKYFENAAKIGNLNAIQKIQDIYSNEIDKYTPDDVGRALYWCGCMYYNGENYVKQDYDIAFDLFTNSAKLKNKWAMWRLGNMYRYGENRDVNNLLALEWYQISADLGFINAGYSIARLYFHGGIGFEINEKIGKEWYVKVLTMKEDDAWEFNNDKIKDLE